MYQCFLRRPVPITSLLTKILLLTQQNVDRSKAAKHEANYSLFCESWSRMYMKPTFILTPGVLLCELKNREHFDLILTGQLCAHQSEAT